MKKVIFGLAVVAAAAFGAYNANKTDAKAEMSDLQKENVEALGQSEVLIIVGHVCQNKEDYTCEWSDGFRQPGWFMGLHPNGR